MRWRPDLGDDPSIGAFWLLTSLERANATEDEHPLLGYTTHPAGTSVHDVCHKAFLQASHKVRLLLNRHRRAPGMILGRRADIHEVGAPLVSDMGFATAGIIRVGMRVPPEPQPHRPGMRRKILLERLRIGGAVDPVEIGSALRGALFPTAMIAGLPGALIVLPHPLPGPRRHGGMYLSKSNFIFSCSAPINGKDMSMKKHMLEYISLRT